MSNLALSQHLRITPGNTSTGSRPKLKVVEPLPVARRTVLLSTIFHYFITAAIAIPLVILLNYLAPSGEQQLPTHAVLAGTASFFLLASLPLAQHVWQRITGAIVLTAQFACALTAQWSPETANLSFLLMSAGSLFMIHASREHNWHTPGVFLLSTILATGLFLSGTIFI